MGIDIRCMDCLEGMKQILDKSIDLIICDLPYGKTKFEWDKKIDLNLLWEQYNRIRKKDSPIILFGKQPFTSELVYSNLKLFRYELIWEKTRASNNMLVKKQPSQIHENILVFYESQPIYNDIKFQVSEKYIDKRKNIRDSFYSKGHYTGVMYRKIDDGLRHSQSVLPFNSVWRTDMHPTEKPLLLFKYLIKTYSKEKDLILDNCMGSGTTAVACKQLGRDFIGFEISQEYVDIANKRVEQELMQLKLDL